MKKKLLVSVLAVAALTTLAACSSNSSSSGTKVREYKLGVASDQEKKEWTQVAKDVKKDHIKIDIKEFSDYTEENPALVDGSLDLNAFQSIAYLNNFNKTKNEHLVSLGYTYISPLGLYSNKIKDPKDLKDGDSVAIPNDPTNEGRALQLLQAVGAIKLKDNAGTYPSVSDIAKYTKKISIKTLDASQVAAALPDVTAAVINTNYAQDQLKKTPKDAIYRDTDQGDKVSQVYKNALVVNSKNKNNKDFKTLLKAYQSEDVEKIIKAGGDAAAWK